MPKPIHRPEYAAVRSLLREHRLAAGMKQTELSAALGKPQPFISAIETGHRRIDLVEVRDICLALGRTLPDFIAVLEKNLAQPAASSKSAKRLRRIRG